MAKKMTLKEFKEVLENAELELDFWGYEGILNMLACHMSHCADDMRANGYEHAANAYDNRFRTIHETLSSRGYFED